MQITRLRCEYLENPLGLETTHPRFFWQMNSEREGARQIAYRILADNGWDSGRVESAQSTQIAYDGPLLTSRQRVNWSVEVEDETGATTKSDAAFWEMGLLQGDDWQADFIAGDLVGGPNNPMPAPFFRRPFQVDKPIKSARLYATALGIYECEINGARVGKNVFAPGWTDYNYRLDYQTYDVTELISHGDNVLGAVVGDGWYCGHIGWRTRQNYGQKPHFCGQLEIEFEDGSREVIKSDADWQFAYGPILSADLLIGEDYDARLEMDGWSAPDFTSGECWRAVQVAPLDRELSSSQAPPIVRTQEITPIATHRHGASVIFDMGQNMVGRIHIKVNGERGRTLKFRFAEILADGPLAVTGPIYTDNLRGQAAEQTNHYTLRGEGEENWEPRFTFHGFRYVEVTGLVGEPAPDFLTGVVLHSEAEQTGDFECSDPLVNQLQKNIDWGWRGNSLDVPTDCPQRDERLGWTGDAQVFIPTSCFLRDVAAFWTKWARDVADAQNADGSVPCVVPMPGTYGAVTNEQGGASGPWHDGGPAWADAVLICPWTLYRRYGDVHILRENYQVFKNYLTYLTSTSHDNIRCDEGVDYWQGFGDWLALDGSGLTVGGTPKELIGTAFYAHCADLMSRIARACGHAEDETHYRELFESVARTFCERYVTPAGRLSPPYQTPYVLALHFNLLPENLRADAVKQLVGEIKHRGGKLSTGFVGTSYLPFVLSENGANQTAYELLLQHDWPSYLYAVTQGATTIWERWDGWTQKKGFQDAGMNSFNHYAYGAIGDWMVQVVAGIRAGKSGYQEFKLQPRPGAGLTAATAHYDSLHGRIESSWKTENGEWIWDFVVPANTRAQVILPGGETFEAQAGKYQRRLKL